MDRLAVAALDLEYFSVEIYSCNTLAVKADNTRDFGENLGSPGRVEVDRGNQGGTVASVS